MTKQHPITPPPELVEQLCNSPDNWRQKLTNAYQAGADQELEACVKWIEDCGIDSVFTYDEDAGDYILSEDFRNARRPKPPSLKELAGDLALIEATLSALRRAGLDAVHENTIRRALEALDD
jgi:hypothetical protein